MAVKRLRRVPATTKVRQTFPSVPANSSSSRLQFDTGNIEGIIKVVRYSTANVVTTNFHIFANSTSLEGTVDEIVEVIDIGQCFQRTNLGIDFENTDTPQEASLYIVIDNQSLVAPTGTVTLELMIQVIDKG